MSAAAAPITKGEAGRKVVRRREARDKLSTFADECGYPPARHHQLLYDTIQRVADGELTRVMFFLPPGSSKSTATSILAPGWIMQRDTWHGGPWDIIGASHGADLANSFSQKARKNIVDNAETLRLEISSEVCSNERWMTTKGDQYRSVGVGGGITGSRADVLIIDDPVRGRKDADSPTDRKTRWDWYLGDARTRLKPHAAIMLVMTRWHEDDLAGRILPEDWAGESGMITARDGEEWLVICIPAICNSENDPIDRNIGEPIWPEWQPLELLEQEEKTQGPRNWNALYQGAPTVEEGDFFQSSWFPRYDHLPKGLRYFITSDFAVSEPEDGSDPDYTVHCVWGLDANNHLWLADLWRDRKLTDHTVGVACDYIAEYEPAGWINEKGVIRKSVGPAIDLGMKDRGAYCRLIDYATTMDKEAEARAIQGRCSQGMVHLPRHATWMATLMKELTAFPGVKHDDQVDCFARMGKHLAVVFKKKGNRSGTARGGNEPVFGTRQ